MVKRRQIAKREVVIPFTLIKVTKFNEKKFSRTRRLIEQ